MVRKIAVARNTRFDRSSVIDWSRNMSSILCCILLVLIGAAIAWRVYGYAFFKGNPNGRPSDLDRYGFRRRGRARSRGYLSFGVTPRCRPKEIGLGFLEGNDIHSPVFVQQTICSSIAWICIVGVFFFYFTVVVLLIVVTFRVAPVVVVVVVILFVIAGGSSYSAKERLESPQQARLLLFLLLLLFFVWIRARCIAALINSIRMGLSSHC